MVLSPSLRPRQERGLEDHRALAELEPDPKEMPAHSPMCLPLDYETQAGKQATRVRSSALPLICPVVLGSSQALHLPTWKAESESLGVYSNSSLWPQSGLGVEFPRCPRDASARTKGAESLPSALGQPPSRSSLAPWLRFSNPGSGSSVAPRHSRDSASGSRLPWEPRPGPCAR